MTSVDVAEVTQADREAAWRFRGYSCSTDPGDDWCAGKHDDAPIIQAFARHRLASTAALLTAHEAALERVRVETLEEAARIADQNSCIAAARIRVLKDRRP